MSVQLRPLSVDLNTWPIPAPGPSVKRREKPFSTTYRAPDPSTATPPTYRFGTARLVGPTTSLNDQLLPLLVPTTMPRANPALLQGPHQPAIAFDPRNASAVATRFAGPNV